MESEGGKVAGAGSSVPEIGGSEVSSGAGGGTEGSVVIAVVSVIEGVGAKVWRSSSA